MRTLKFLFVFMNHYSFYEKHLRIETLQTLTIHAMFLPLINEYVVLT